MYIIYKKKGSKISLHLKSCDLNQMREYTLIFLEKNKEKNKQIYMSKNYRKDKLTFLRISNSFYRSSLINRNFHCSMK